MGRARSPITVRHLPGLYPLWGQFIEGHGIYFRDPIDMQARGIAIDQFDEIKLLKLAAFAEVFGQIEYAFELLLWSVELLRSRDKTPAADRVANIAQEAEQRYIKYMS